MFGGVKRPIWHNEITFTGNSQRMCFLQAGIFIQLTGPWVESHRQMRLFVRVIFGKLNHELHAF